LLSAGENASEVELLRTVAARLGVKWGNDDLGWWAVVEAPKYDQTNWSVWREDDNGARFLVEEGISEKEAEKLVFKLESSAHKQMYWMARPDS